MYPFSHERENSGKSPYDFADLGVCIDLIGNGDIQTVDLLTYGIKSEGGIWRNVKLNDGWFQVFRDIECQGVFNTIFLSEWVAGTVNSFKSWNCDEKISSINYPRLNPPHILQFFQHEDGQGKSLSLGAKNVFGSFGESATVNTLYFGLQDNISSFKYSFIPFDHVNIDSVTLALENIEITPGYTFTDNGHYDNGSAETPKYTTTVAKDKTYTVSNTVSLEYSTQIAVSSTVSVSAGLFGTTTSGSITTSFTTTKSDTTTDTKTSTEEIRLETSVEATVPPWTIYDSTLRIGFGSFKPRRTTTIGTFYYNKELQGSIFDKDTQLWKLTGELSFLLEGAVGTQREFTARTTPVTPA